MAKKGWIMLKNLRPGAVFQTQDGKTYTKVCTPHYNGVFTSWSISLQTGEWDYFAKADKELVREVLVNPVGYYWVGILIGMARAAKLSDEDKAKLDTFTKQLLDGFGM